MGHILDTLRDCTMVYSHLTGHVRDLRLHFINGVEPLDGKIRETSRCAHNLRIHIKLLIALWAQDF